MQLKAMMSLYNKELLQPQPTKLENGKARMSLYNKELLDTLTLDPVTLNAFGIKK